MSAPKAYVCGLDDDTIRAIALECGFKLKTQENGEEDLNPYVYKFANEILSTMPAPEDVAKFRNALDTSRHDDLVKAAEWAFILLDGTCSGDRWKGTEQEKIVKNLRAALDKVKS